jgi:hypothetical protein
MAQLISEKFGLSSPLCVPGVHLKKEQSFTETFMTRHRAGIRKPKKPNSK